MVRWYNKHAQEVSEYNPGDEVMLDRRNVQTKCSLNKLDNKKFDSLKVLNAVGKIVYRLKLSQNTEIQAVFHTAAKKNSLHKDSRFSRKNLFCLN